MKRKEEGEEAGEHERVFGLFVNEVTRWGGFFWSGRGG